MPGSSTACHVGQTSCGLCIIIQSFRHNDQPFSKFAFLMGSYDKVDMATLNLTNIRDFATFNALDSAHLGLNRDVALENLNQILLGRTFAEYCNVTVKIP